MADHKQLIAACGDDRLFQDQMGVCYAWVALEEKRRRLMRLRGRDYKNLLIWRAVAIDGKIPSSNTVVGVLAQLEWKASSTDPLPLENRFARDGDSIWLD